MTIMHAQPEALAATSGGLQSINAALNAGSAAAAIPTTSVIPAGADLVSALTAAQFVKHAELYQQISAQASAIHEQMALTLGISAGSYAVTEAANVAAIG